MTDSPSVLLQRAADKLEQLAVHFEVYEQAQARDSEFPSASARWIHLNVATASHLPANEWMWTMTPAVAAPLANILRYEARTNGSAHRGDLIAIARAVLAAPSKEEEAT